MQEAGTDAVHHVTAGVAKIKRHNLHRDLFRYIKLPIDVSYVRCPVLLEPWMNDRVDEADLPMIDPHEMMEYLNRSGRLEEVSPQEIAILDLSNAFYLSFWG